MVAGIYFRLKIEVMLSSCEKSEHNHLPMLSECVDNPLKNVSYFLIFYNSVFCYIDFRYPSGAHSCRWISRKLNSLNRKEVIGQKYDRERDRRG